MSKHSTFYRRLRDHEMREQRLRAQRARQYPNYADAIMFTCESCVTKWRAETKRLSSGKLKRLDRMVRCLTRATGQRDGRA